MNNKNKRPVYLNLFQIRLPVAGVVSILHRITGVVMVISLPLSLYALQQSLASADEYATVTGYLSLPGWVCLSALQFLRCCHHPHRPSLS